MNQEKTEPTTQRSDKILSLSLKLKLGSIKHYYCSKEATFSCRIRIGRKLNHTAKNEVMLLTIRVLSWSPRKTCNRKDTQKANQDCFLGGQQKWIGGCSNNSVFSEPGWRNVKEPCSCLWKLRPQFKTRARHLGGRWRPLSPAPQRHVTKEGSRVWDGEPQTIHQKQTDLTFHSKKKKEKKNSFGAHFFRKKKCLLPRYFGEEI